MSDTFVGDESSFRMTDAQRRYVERFGAPVFTEGPARQPYTASVAIADAPAGEADPEGRVAGGLADELSTPHAGLGL